MIRVAVLMIVAIFILSFHASGKVAAHPRPPSGMMQQRPSMTQHGMMLRHLTGRDLEIAFLGAMIPHHQVAVDMSQLAPSRAGRAEVRQAAEKIIASQQREIDLMTNWLNAWYGLTPDEAMRRMRMMRGMEQMMDQMEEDNKKMMRSLESLRGEAFDREFLEMMIPHHQSAIVMAQPVTKKPVRAEVHTLAHSIIRTQGQEIAQFKRWLQKWGM